MSVNQGYMDRAARQASGIAMIALALSGTVTGGAGIVLLVIGASALMTGTLGYCPLYTLFGWNTYHQSQTSA